MENADGIRFNANMVPNEPDKISLFFDQCAQGSYFCPSPFKLADFRNLVREVLGESSGWVDGVPSEPGRYIVAAKDNPDLYGLATVPALRKIGEMTLAGGCDLPVGNIAAYCRIPDRPKDGPLDRLRKAIAGLTHVSHWKQYDELTAAFAELEASCQS